MACAARHLPVLALLAVALLVGCGGGSNSSGTTPPPVTTPPTPATQHGTVFGGTIPVIGATIQLYAVGTTADGSAATPLLNPAVTSDSTGSFTMQGSEACPSASSLVYLVATGGNPGLATGTNNKALSMMAAIGPCSGLTPSASFVVNELTTVAAVYALEPYFTSPTAIGASPANAAALTSAFTLAAAFANPATGVTPGTAVPAGDTVPVEQINTLADILATCIDTTGGAAGDSSPCGDLLTLATPSGATAPANTLTALLNIAQNPTLNVASLFHLVSDSGPFQPIPAQAPLDWTVHLQLPSTLKITPAAGLTFAATPVSNTAPTQAITLTNTGSSAIALSSLSLAGLNAADFAQTSNCAAALQPQATCTATVSFTPTAAGSRTAYLVVTSNAPNSPQPIPLTGTATASAPTISLSPTSLIFASETVGTTSSPQSVTLTNNGNAPLTLTSITLTGTNAADYTLTNACSGALAASAHCTLTVTFKPTAAGTRTAAIRIAASAASSPTTVAITGTATAATPTISLSAPSLTFASQLVGSTSTPQTITLTNTGNATLNLTSIALSGANAADYALTNACSTTLAAAAHCAFTVAFDPAAAGTRTAVVTIVSNATSSPNTITLTGSGTATTPTISLSPVSLTFASQLVGSPSVPQTVTLTNSGNATLNLTGISLTGANAADYTLTNACSTTLAASAHCTFTVAFNPTAAGTRTAAVTITSNATTASTIPLTGIATTSPPPSSITLSTNSLAFTNYAVSFNTPVSSNPTITGNTVTVTNNGSAPLLISAINISPSFYQTNNCGSELLGQSVCTISVWPIEVPAPSTTATSYTGTLTLVSNDPTAPSTVALSNTVNVSATANDFGTWAVGMPSNAPLVIEGNVAVGHIESYNAIMSGPDSADFLATPPPDNQCGEPEGACNEQVVFQPTTTGKRLSVYVVLGPGEYSGTTVIREVHVLSGEGQEAGPSIALTSPVSIYISDSSSFIYSLTLVNNGTTNLDLSPLTSSTTDAVITPNPACEKLAIGASCTFNMTYKSSAVGTHVLTFSSVDAVSGKTLSASLNATVGYTAPSASPSTLTFGPIHLGTTASQTFTVTNPYVHPLTLAQSCGSGSCATDFIFPPTTCNSATCTFTVTYAPTGTPSNTFTADYGSVKITDTVTSLAVSVTLTGYPGAPTLTSSPSFLNFSTRPVGTMSISQTITITNTGDAPLNLPSISLTGANAADYALTNVCPSPLSIASSCTLNVSFSPTAAGTRTAAVTITSNAPSSPNTLPISGIATTP